jgi:hypothetical protein
MRDEKRKAESETLRWFQRESQEAWFDEWGYPWARDPVRWYMGPEILPPWVDGGEGKWVRVGGTVKRADE